MRPTSVVLPEPDGPTSARLSPAAISRSTSRSTGRSGSYPNVTPSSEIRPSTGPIGTASGASRIVGSRVDDLEHALDGPGPLAELPVQAGDRAEAGADGDPVEEEAR